MLRLIRTKCLPMAAAPGLNYTPVGFAASINKHVTVTFVIAIFIVTTSAQGVELAVRQHRVLEHMRRWQAGELDNFGYLMHLNSIAGEGWCAQ